MKPLVGAIEAAPAVELCSWEDNYQSASRRQGIKLAKAKETLNKATF
jgi:hypothetical protein